MKNLNRRLSRTSTLAAAVAMSIGVITLTQSKAEAFPVLLCGPDFQWVCTGQGGPKILFQGTICDARAFERRNNVTCTRN